MELEGKEVKVISRSRRWCPWFRSNYKNGLKAPKTEFNDVDIAKYMYRIVDLYPQEIENLDCIKGIIRF